VLFRGGGRRRCSLLLPQPHKQVPGIWVRHCLAQRALNHVVPIVDSSHYRCNPTARQLRPPPATTTMLLSKTHSMHNLKRVESTQSMQASSASTGSSTPARVPITASALTRVGYFSVESTAPRPSTAKSKRTKSAIDGLPRLSSTHRRHKSDTTSGNDDIDWDAQPVEQVNPWNNAARTTLDAARRSSRRRKRKKKGLKGVKMTTIIGRNDSWSHGNRHAKSGSKVVKQTRVWSASTRSNKFLNGGSSFFDIPGAKFVTEETRRKPFPRKPADKVRLLVGRVRKALKRLKGKGKNSENLSALQASLEDAERVRPGLCCVASCCRACCGAVRDGVAWYLVCDTVLTSCATVYFSTLGAQGQQRGAGSVQQRQFRAEGARPHRANFSRRRQRTRQ